MKLQTLSIAALASTLFLSTTSTAQVTRSIHTLGGASAQACRGFGGVATLSDGTLACGKILYEYNSTTGVLLATVSNDSPVIPGLNTPLITDVYFNLPPGAISGATLTNQTGPMGSAPAFTLSFDVDPGTAPNPNRARCLGFFGIHLASPGGLTGSISNPNATSVAAPAGTFVDGAVTFELQLTGASSTCIDAHSIVASQSRDSLTLGQASPAAANFAGGARGGSSEVGVSACCITGIYKLGDARVGGTFDFCVTGGVDCHVCVWVSATQGPSLFQQYQLPVGQPILHSIDFGAIGGSTTLCTPVTIPNAPALAGTTVYYTNITYPSIASDAFQFSAPYAITILP